MQFKPLSAREITETTPVIHVLADKRSRPLRSAFRMASSVLVATTLHSTSARSAPLQPPALYFTNSATGLTTPVNGKTISVVIGEKIDMSVLAFDSPPPPQPWTITGSPIGGYRIGSNVDQPCTGLSCTPGQVTQVLTLFPQLRSFYWTRSGSYTVTYRAPSGTATTRFTVSGPTMVSATATPSGTIQILPYAPPRYRLSFGDRSNRLPGIIFKGKGTPPPQAGDFEWIQLLKSYNVIYTVKSGNISDIVVPGLDSIYPYSRSLSPTDSPSIPLLSCHTSADLEEHFRMFLMWKAALPQSITVPLGYIDWSWSASADKINGVWTLSSAYKNAEPFKQSSTFPQWNNTTISSPAPCQ